jgi:hypothetical protein
MVLFAMFVLRKRHNEVTTADGGWRVLFALTAQRPATAEFLRWASPMPARLLHTTSVALLLAVTAGCRSTENAKATQPRTVPESISPQSAAPATLPLRLNEAQAIEIAARELARLRISTAGFQGPIVLRPTDRGYTGRLIWTVFYHRDRFPGDHFSVWVDDEDGKTRFWGGQ